ncbi:hypothetical protein HID58_076407 [Brassica napus]|uniref:Uncharacterized protein n=1 Tax=Brassica napus TaxID=3708 RepID=A0ABQ7YQM5_BRANA|nr:hypothetical protein HID58_076407 [Brassica napus]
MAKKKKKPKINPEDETPSGSSASSGSQDSAQVSLELVADSTSDLRTLGFSVSSVSLAMSSKHIVDPSGAVAATIIDSAQSEPCYGTRVAAEASTSDIELIVEPTGAVTATITDAEPIVDSSSAVTATTTESSQRNLISEIQATDFEAIVEPVGAITATITVSAQGNPNTEILDTVTDTLEDGELVPPPSSEPATDHSVPAEIAADLHGASDCTRLRTGLRKDKAPIASQVPIVGNAPSVQTSKKHVGSVARSSLPLVVKKKSSEVVHTGSGQEAEAGTSKKGQAGQTQAPARKDLLVVDLNGPGSVSFGHSIPSSDSGLDSSSDSQRVRKQLWADLRFLDASPQLNHLPWRTASPPL